MKTLKQIRIEKGLYQSDLAELIKVSIPEISNYENNISLPNLEDCIILEIQLSSKIQWNEQLSPAEKHETVQNLIELFERYPLQMVLEFGSRMYRREKEPERYIAHYSRASVNNDIEPLYPVEFDNDK